MKERDAHEGAEPGATLTAVVCAYTEDRWDDIVAAIESLAGQQPQPLQTILVIDHNDVLLERCRAAFPAIDVIPSTGAKGLSGARNTAVAASKGDIVAFLDDDAVAGSGWVAGMSRWYVDAHVVSVGGKVSPRWPGERPGWFPPEFDWVVGCSHLGLPGAPSEIRNGIGSSVSFRRSAVLATSGFDEQVGRIDTLPLGCEETELSIRLRQLDPEATIMYDPSVTALHRVTPIRTTWKYYRSRCWSEGLSKAAVRDRVGATSALEAEKTYVTRTLPKAVLRGLAHPVRGWLEAVAVVVGLAWTTAGYTVGVARSRRR